MFYDILLHTDGWQRGHRMSFADFIMIILTMLWIIVTLLVNREK